LEYCLGIDASRGSDDPDDPDGPASGAVRGRGTLGLRTVTGVSIRSSVMSALYLTCRIRITCHKAVTVAHALQY
jgi:hypothetical protein